MCWPRPYHLGRAMAQRSWRLTTRSHCALHNKLQIERFTSLVRHWFGAAGFSGASKWRKRGLRTVRYEVCCTIYENSKANIHTKHVAAFVRPTTCSPFAFSITRRPSSSASKGNGNLRAASVYVRATARSPTTLSNLVKSSHSMENRSELFSLGDAPLSGK